MRSQCKCWNVWEPPGSPRQAWMVWALGFEPGLLCPRSCAEAVASRQPRCETSEELGAAGLDGWRLELLGEGFLKALADE